MLITLATVALAVPLGWAMWDAYMGAPWTRDGTVRAYVVTMAPEVAGRIVELPVVDNQFVHKGDLLMTIDPTNYRIAVSLAEAAVQQTEANGAERRARGATPDGAERQAVTVEEQQILQANAVAAQAQHQQALANLEQARVNLERTRILSPVNGWVTNLLAQLGDYANVGDNTISLVDADSFWVDGYFEETNLGPIRVGDPATIKLMGYARSCAATSTASRAPSTSRTRNPTSKGSLRSTRSSPGCAWPSAFRCGSRSIRCPTASPSRPA